MIFKPETYHIVIIQGSDFCEEFTFSDTLGTPVNLSGASFAGQIRTDFNAVTGSNLTVNVLDVTGGTFALTMPMSATMLLPVASTGGREVAYGVYDIEIVHEGDQSRLLQGNVTISKEVTKI